MKLPTTMDGKQMIQIEENVEEDSILTDSSNNQNSFKKLIGQHLPTDLEDDDLVSEFKPVYQAQKDMNVEDNPYDRKEKESGILNFIDDLNKNQMQ